MTAQVLNTELTSLVQDSKRKNPELRTAAERSLQDLKSLHVTSETQLAADLIRRPHFITPFIIACQSKNVKFASSGAGCLQRLAVSSALPKERLKEVVESLKDCSSSSLEVQLKILQTLPALSQNYSSEIRGDLLFGLLQICSALQASKQYAVSNSSAATLQQLIITLFENLEIEDRKALEIPIVTSVQSDKEKIQVRPVAYDAYRTFHDLCLLTEGSKPNHIRLTTLPQASGLELLESILSNHASAFDNHPEQGYILRTVLLPFIIRALSERQTFPITVRIMRVLAVVVRRHLAIAPAECEVALGLLNHMLDPDAAPLWKRALSLEIFRQIYSDIGLILRICSHYDDVEGKKKILRDNLTLFVRIASEKPSAIGLGQQSTVPGGQPSDDEATGNGSIIDSTGMAGIIEAPLAANRDSMTGLSMKWSSIRVQCLDQLDKSDPPQLPETYIFSLVLTCINNLSENLARFILPLTVHKEPRGRKRAGTQTSVDRDNDAQEAADEIAKATLHRKRAVPINPLTLESHKNYESIRAIAAIIDHGWPAVMACCSTFLYAAMDNDYYRALVRSFQKFTQVAGLLRMSTPRDAFLTTLGKAAVPANVVANNLSPSTPAVESSSMFQNARGLLNVDSIVSSANAVDHQRRTSMDLGSPSLNGRNLLCLRALLNVAIALGPTLDDAWKILCETLQQSEMIMATSTIRGTHRLSVSSVRSSEQGEDVVAQSIAGEVAAVQAAASRLFESTSDYPDDAFKKLIQALCQMLHDGIKGSKPDSAQVPASPQPHAQRTASSSLVAINTDNRVQNHLLALQKIGEVVSLNIDRFAQSDDASSGWNLLLDKLKTFATAQDADPKPRRMAAEIMSRIVQDAVQASTGENIELQSRMQRRSLEALLACIQDLGKSRSTQSSSANRDTDLDAHFIWLQALRSILERNGDAIADGWDVVFDIILTAFRPHEIPSASLTPTLGDLHQELDLHFRSPRLGQAAFDVMQLVCSDFLRSVANNFFWVLVDLPFRFCAQLDNLNISLTMTGIFWQLSDFLHETLSSNDVAHHLNSRSRQNKGEEEPKSRTGAWIYLLDRLIIVTTDPRLEVRNAAIHTLLRIFGSYDLSASALTSCIGNILLHALKLNLWRHKQLADAVPDSELRLAWHESSQLLVTGVADLIAAKIAILIEDTDWSDLWKSVVTELICYLQLQQRSLHGVVFIGLTKILSKIQPPAEMTPTDLDVALQLWQAYPPAEALAGDHDRTTESFEAYAHCFQEIHTRFHAHMLVGALEKSADNLLNCLEAAHGTRYGTDLDAMTPLQSSTLSCFEEMHQRCPVAQALLVQSLSRAIALPLSVAGNTDTPSEVTFVAFSKTSMDLLCAIMRQGKLQRDDHLGLTLVAAIKSLSRHIDNKYQWLRQGHHPALWQKATSTSLVIVETVFSSIDTTSMASDIVNRLWLALVEALHFIASADCSTHSNLNAILADEQFDVASISAVRRAIIPKLGSSTIPYSTRRIYASNLFLNSLIHKTERGEFPLPPEEPLSNLYEIRLGRTTNDPPSVRSQMAYFCFSELISMTSVSGSSTPPTEVEQQRIQLARAAAPYLILRAALPIKAYIADQPLRGRMPQPFPQQQELLFVLKKMRKLQTEPRAIPEVDGAATEHKRHLVRLLPLINKAVAVAGSRKGLARDEEVMEELLGWQADVTDQFEL